MTDLRVGIVCPYSLTVPGGVQAQALGMARELRRRGVEARILAPCDGPPPAPYVTPLGNSLPTAANGSIAPLAPDPSAVLRLIRAVNDEAFDVLHLHEPLAPGPTVTALLLHPAPLVGTFHAAGESSSYRLFGPILERLAARLDHRVVVSKDALALVGEFVDGDYEVLFNGVEVETIRDARPYRVDRPTILFLGRHEERKGLGVLLEALRLIDLDIGCWVAGEGPDTQQLKSRFGDDRRIEWLGRISEEEKLARLRAATVFCAPSLRGESFGVVLIEAMAAETAVVASALDGYRNVATDGVDAVLVPPGDAPALANAIVGLLADPDRRALLVRAGSLRANDFSMSLLMERYLEIYLDVTKAHQGRKTSRRFGRSGDRTSGWAWRRTMER